MGRRYTNRKVLRGEEGLHPKYDECCPSTEAVRRLPDIVVLGTEGRVRCSRNSDEDRPDKECENSRSKRETSNSRLLCKL